MTEEKAPAPPADSGRAAPATGAPPAASPSEAKAPPQAPRAKPSFHIYSRQKDQHVVGPGCWCMPKVEIVEGRRIVIHKRD
jgi:hypothetical protein